VPAPELKPEVMETVAPLIVESLASLSVSVQVIATGGARAF
jgi:hypothetical protein